jgi:hypothetical protein
MHKRHSAMKVGGRTLRGSDMPREHVFRCWVPRYYAVEFLHDGVVQKWEARVELVRVRLAGPLMRPVCALVFCKNWRWR